MHQADAYVYGCCHDYRTASFMLCASIRQSHLQDVGLLHIEQVLCMRQMLTRTNSRAPCHNHNAARFLTYVSPTDGDFRGDLLLGCPPLLKTRALNHSHCLTSRMLVFCTLSR
jgi:hypothetical protein